MAIYNIKINLLRHGNYIPVGPEKKSPREIMVQIGDLKKMVRRKKIFPDDP